MRLADQADFFFASTTGETGIWRPQSHLFVMNQVGQIGERFVTHLFLVDPETQQMVNLSGSDRLVEDGSPAWSPYGRWLVFGRKELTGPSATLGKQLWRMAADGGDAQPLTADAAFDSGSTSWSPDGRYLLFHRLPLKGPDITLSVWGMEFATGQMWEVARPGQRPQWLP